MPAGSDQSHSFEMRETRTVGGASLKYRPAIDGLRAIAVLAVLVFHLERQWLPGGFIGVDVFFVISGFLITSILLKEYEHGSFSLWKFYQRRIARLFPAFYTVAVSTIIAASLLYSGQDFASCGTGLYTASLFVANLKYMLQGSYFTISPDAQPFLHCWSLSVEEQFYMIFPALLLLLYWKANRYKTGVLMLLCGASLAACVVMTQIKPAWAFYLLPTRAWELLAGSILANLGETFPAGNDKKLSPAWLPAAGLALIAISLFTIHEGRSFPGYRAIFPVLGTVAFLDISAAQADGRRGFCLPVRWCSSGECLIRFTYGIGRCSALSTTDSISHPRFCGWV